MKTRKISQTVWSIFLSCTFLCLGSVLSTSCSDDDSGSTENGQATSFLIGDLEATWHSHSLFGDLDGMNWGYGTTILDSQGAGTVNWQNADGTSGSDTTSFTLSDTGVVGISADDDFSGIMSFDKEVIVAADTWEDNTSALTVLVHGGGAFSQRDLAGTWHSRSLIVGPTSRNWGYGTVQLSEEGVGHVSWQNADRSSGEDETAYALAANGMLSEPGEGLMHGIMSPDKELIVFTDTWYDDASVLTFLVRTGENFVQADLEGRWLTRSLAMGDGTISLGRGDMVLDSQGAGTLSWENADGTSGSDDVGFTMDKSGSISGSDGGDFHGVMSIDGNFFVAVDTWDDNVSALTIGVKGVR